MLVRIFTLKFDPVLGAFDDGTLRDFVKDKEILSIRDHFFSRDEIPYLAVVVTYHPLRPAMEEKTRTDRAGEDREKWRAILEERMLTNLLQKFTVRILKWTPCTGPLRANLRQKSGLLPISVPPSVRNRVYFEGDLAWFWAKALGVKYPKAL